MLTKNRFHYVELISFTTLLLLVSACRYWWLSTGNPVVPYVSLVLISSLTGLFFGLVSTGKLKALILLFCFSLLQFAGYALESSWNVGVSNFPHMVKSDFADDLYPYVVLGFVYIPISVICGYALFYLTKTVLTRYCRVWKGSKEENE